MSLPEASERLSERGGPPRGIKLEGVVEASLMFSARGLHREEALLVLKGEHF